jgi:hypothetical protein
VLATVLFTDIVGSTEKLAELGDREWKVLLQRHHALVRRQLVRYSGREIDTAGDGFFASFDGPARAIRCACAISEAIAELGLQVRGEVLVSSTVKDLVAGSGNPVPARRHCHAQGAAGRMAAVRGRPAGQRSLTTRPTRSGCALLVDRRREADVVQLVTDDFDRMVRILIQAAVGVEREWDDAGAHEREPLDCPLEVPEDVPGLAMMDDRVEVRRHLGSVGGLLGRV